jgi:hypothetical protein
MKILHRKSLEKEIDQKIYLQIVDVTDFDKIAKAS